MTLTKASIAVSLLLGLCILLAGCGSEASAEPRGLLLAPEDFQMGDVSVTSLTEEQSLDGPSAQVELQGPGFRVVQSLVIFETREGALAALDGIRADLANQGKAEPGGKESSGVLEHRLGAEDAGSVFFIEGSSLVRLTVTGPDRARLVEEWAKLARSKISGG